MNELTYTLSEYPYLIVDLAFICAICLIVIFSKKGCAYKHSTALLAGQLLTTISFTTILIALQVKFGDQFFYDGVYFYAPLAFTYFFFYRVIGKTGDKHLANLSLFIGSYHFAVSFGLIINFKLNEFLGVGYESVMVLLTSLQLLLAFRGWLYGARLRISDARGWSNNNRHNIV